MRSLKAALTISVLRLRQCVKSERTIMVAVLMGIYAFSTVQPVVDFARSVEERVTPYAPPFVISDIVCQMFLMIASIALFSSAPFKDDLYAYLLPRSGKTAMVLGNLLGIYWVALLYVAYLFVMMAVPMVGSLTFEAKWGKIWSTIAVYPPDSSFGIMFSVGDAIRVQFSPLSAMILVYFLESACVAFLGVCVYLGNQLTNRPLGLWLACGISVLDITVYNIFPSSINRFSPLSLARLSNYASGYSLPMGRSPVYGFLFYGLGIALMTLIIRLNEGARKNLTL